MSRQIIKQPNGRFCIFSSICDNVTFYDMTEKDIIDEWVKEYKAETEKHVKSVIEKLNNGGKPYYQFTIGYDEMLDRIKEIHNKKEYLKVKKLIEKQ